MKFQRTAVTRIDLIVALVIVALVPVVITASLGTARHLAKIPLCANNLWQIGAAVYDYAQIYDGNLPNICDPDGDEEGHHYVAYRSDKFFLSTFELVPYRFACLYEAGLIEDARVFYCPANTDPFRMFKSYNNPAPWGTLPQVYNYEFGQNQWVRAGYEWYPVDENPEFEPFKIGKRPPAPRYLCRKFDSLDPNLPYCTDVFTIRTLISHQYDQVIGLNILYSDGHVFFQDDPDILGEEHWDVHAGAQPRNTIRAIYYQRILALAGQNPYPD